MRNTLVPPANSLDHRDGNSELVTETTAPVTNHTANSLVATGGTLSLVPTSVVTCEECSHCGIDNSKCKECSPVN